VLETVDRAQRHCEPGPHQLRAGVGEIQGDCAGGRREIERIRAACRLVDGDGALGSRRELVGVVPRAAVQDLEASKGYGCTADRAGVRGSERPGFLQIAGREIVRALAAGDRRGGRDRLELEAVVALLAIGDDAGDVVVGLGVVVAELDGDVVAGRRAGRELLDDDLIGVVSKICGENAGADRCQRRWRRR